jgi:hypothetical protein
MIDEPDTWAHLDALAKLRRSLQVAGRPAGLQESHFNTASAFPTVFQTVRSRMLRLTV